MYDMLFFHNHYTEADSFFFFFFYSCNNPNKINHVGGIASSLEFNMRKVVYFIWIIQPL